jgi:beta-lactamase class D
MRRCAAGILIVLGAGFASNVGAAPLCTVLAEADSGKILKQQGTCEARLTPVSTFKIALSLIGYDAGFLTDEHHPALPYHEGYVASDPSWKTTVDPTTWITKSVVWYSQQLTTWLGEERLQRYVTRFKYGNQDLSGNPGMNDGLTQAWLDSSLRISPLEQVSFLEKVVNRQLGVSAHAYEMTAHLTAVGTLPNGWEVHGKTGTGFQMKADDGPDLTRQVGWYVGWASRGPRTVVFVYVIADEQPVSARAGPRAREAFTQRLPALLEGTGGGR